MDDQVTPALAQSSASRAFDELRGEVSLLRRAIEGLAAERRDQPDYGPTLEALAAASEQTKVWARKISEKPAIQLTPRQISQEIDASVATRRQQDQKELAMAQAGLKSAIADVKSISFQVRNSHEQVRQVKIVGGVCFLGGFVLGPLLAQVELLWR